MSPLEAMIWTVLGYITMPLIFIVGFIGTAAVVCFFLEAMGRGKTEET